MWAFGVVVDAPFLNDDLLCYEVRSGSNSEVTFVLSVVGFVTESRNSD